ncbi:MAG: hypothetical protein ACYC7J_01765 [Syntrophales bacterium]
MGSILWWGKNIVILLVAVFFLIFGIETLIGSFTLKNPLEFIVYFFSSSFMVLVSIVGIIYPVFQVHGYFKPRKIDTDAKP